MNRNSIIALLAILYNPQTGQKQLYMRLGTVTIPRIAGKRLNNLKSC